MKTYQPQALLLLAMGMLFCGIPQAAAQTTGKVTGVVADAVTGEPLIGVNVFIEETLQGAVTNIDGEYVIIGVRPGTVTVAASFIGFATERKQGVSVNAGLTTEVDFRLREEVFEGEEVVVTAERPLIQKDVTATTAIVSGENIRALPVENFGEVLSLQAGVVDGHFRGGRTGEVGYWVDGMPVTDVFDGSLGVSVENNMIQEVQVVTGAFNAEYGQAMSGIVNIVTRDGGNDFEGGFSAFTGDYLSPRDDLFFNIDDFNPTAVRNLEADLSGPILRDRLFFFSSGRYFRNDGWLYGRRVFGFEDVGRDATGQLGLLNPGGSGDSSVVSMNPYEKVSGQVKLTWRLGGINLQATGIASREDFKGYNHALRFIPQNQLDEQKTARTIFLKATHALSNTTFYELGVTNTRTEFENYLFEDPLDERYLLNEYYGFTEPLLTAGFLIGGTNPGRFSRSTNTWLGKFDLTSQVDKRNLVKFGIELRRHDLAFLDQFTSVFEQGGQVVRQLNTNGEYNYKPLEFAAYVQDKIEFGSLIVNVGLRYDYFDSDGKVFRDATDPELVFEESRQNLTEDQVFKDAGTKSQFSPRLGVSFPVSEGGVVHFSYGWFFQVPNFELLYRNPFFRLGTGGSGLIGLVGNADLSPQKTINGEIGLKQQLSSNIAVEVTAFFRDISDLAGTATEPIVLEGTSARYGRFANSDFGLVRGIIFRYDQRLTGNFNMNVDYTFQVAKGNASDPALVFNAAAANQQLEQQIISLDWDQLHTANVSLNYQVPDNWGFGLIARYGSGLPYTPAVTTQQTGIILPTRILYNSETKPVTWNVNLTVHKSIAFAGTTARIFAKVDNLFDTGNENGVFGDTGRATYSLQRNVDENTFQGDEFFLDSQYTRPDFYNEPRRVTLGVSYRF